MEILNRSAIIVTPRRRFFDWVNRLPDAGSPIRIEEAAAHRTVYLAAAGDEPPLEELIDSCWAEIFEEALAGWTADESLWPINRTPHVFRDWFQVDSIDAVLDLDPGEPVTVFEQGRTRCAMCDRALDEHSIGVAVSQDAPPHRLNALEMNRLDEDRLGDTEDSAPPLFLLRCCGEECAAQAEESLRRAHEQSLSKGADDDAP